MKQNLKYLPYKMLLLMSFFAISCLGQTVDTAYQRMTFKLDSIVQMGIDSMAFPGVNILVLHQGQAIFHQAYGTLTYEGKEKVKKTAIYDMASLSKITTGLPLLMRLYGEGRFDLDKPLSNYLPYFKGSPIGGKTYREILAHQAQLIPYISYWQNAQRKNGHWRWATFKSHPSKRFPIKITDDLYLHRNYQKKMMRAIKNAPLRPQKGYKYSGLGFYLLPRLITAITHQSYSNILYDIIYRPIGATTLGYNPLDRYSANEIVPTEYDSLFRHKLLRGTVHDEGAAMMGGISGNAGLFGNAEDLGKLLQLYLDKGVYQGQQIISASAIDTFTQYAFEAQGNRRGLGFDKPPLEYVWGDSYIAPSASPLSYGHSGYTGTFAWVDPAYDLIFIFLSNRVYPCRAHRQLYKLNIRPILHQIVYDYVLGLEKE